MSSSRNQPFVNSSSEEDMEDFEVTEQDLMDEANNFIGFNKKRRKRTKNDDIYGIFNDQDDDDENGRGELREVRFVASSKPTNVSDSSDEEMEEVLQDVDDSQNDNESSKSSFSTTPFFSSSSLQDGNIEQKEETESRESDSQSNKPFGLGYAPKTSTSQHVKQPTTFSSSKSSKHHHKNSNAPRVDKNFGKFEKHTKGIGLKLLMKMGFKPGEGLGASKQGIVAPVEIKLRPKNLGLAYKNFDERTEAAKAEDREKKMGVEEVKITEEDGQPQILKQNAWKRSHHSKKRSAYKSAEQVLKQAFESVSISTKIIDMTTPETKVITDPSKLKSSPTFLETTKRLPELRFNLRMITDMTQNELLNEGKSIQIERKRELELTKQLEQLRVELSASKQEVNKFEKVMDCVNQCKEKSNVWNPSLEGGTASLMESLSDVFETLQTNYYEEYKRLHLDSLIIALFSKELKYALAQWNPIKEPLLELDTVLRWRKLLKFDHKEIDSLVSFGMFDHASKVHKPIRSDIMTPYESMMFNIWLPRVRTVVNNEWNARDHSSMIHFIESWKLLLPEFIVENILDQLIFPKIKKEVDEWNPKQDAIMINTWLLPWKEILGSRLKTLYITIRYKIGICLREWHPSDQSALAILFPWKKVFKVVELESFLRKNIIPKLESVLEKEFIINPKKQEIEPLGWVLSWKPLMSEELLGTILVQSFFPKWHRALYTWLVDGNANYDEVSQWYMTWKSWFPEDIRESTIIQPQFNVALNMINMSLTSKDNVKLPQQIPDDAVERLATFTLDKHVPEITFKSVVEAFAEENDVMFVPTERREDVTGKPLFKFGGGSAKKMCLVYIDNDVVFMKEGAEWIPIDLDTLLEKVRV